MEKETRYYFDSFNKTYSFQLSDLSTENFEKIKKALKPLGISFRSPKR
jgi:hypothetical protein